jgi:hypothetical protein
MSVREFAKFVDQRMEEFGINRTLLIRISGMTAGSISQILTRVGVPVLTASTACLLPWMFPRKNYSTWQDIF